MSQISSSSRNGAVLGPILMLLASLALAGSNLPQSLLPTPPQYGGYGMASTGMAFWQYLIATVIALPLIMRIGLRNLRTRHPLAHEVRAFVSALGVHVFVYGFAAGVPIWQMVTLLSTGPLFIIIGSTLFLRERATLTRIIASLVAFAGAIIVSGVGTDAFSPMTLVPIGAAALWATTDVLTISLLVLITPNHLLILLVATAWSWLLPSLVPAGLATGFPFALPAGAGLWILLALGVLTAVAQYLLAAAYKLADATYLQPFGDLKVPLSALLGWVLLNQVPSPWFWLGAALILGASIFIFYVETQGKGASPAAVAA